MFTRLLACGVAAMVMGAAGAAVATAQNTESFQATHFSVPEGQNEVPPVESDAGYAVAIMRFDPVASSLQYRVSVALPAGQSITGAHFHKGARGENGPVVHPITFAAGSMTASGIWSNISAEDLAALTTQGIYLNIHTNTNPNGQLRDQVNLIPNLTATEMNSSEEVPPIAGLPATGNSFVYLDQSMKRAAYIVDWDSLSGAPTMAHFHRGARGVAGPVVHPIALPSGAGTQGQLFGIWENITDVDMNDLKSGNMYVNIHTAQHPSGEIRAQVVNTEFYTAAISPANEVPPVSGSNGMGTGFVSIFDKTIARSFFIADGLTGPATMAHIHQAPRGTNGDIKFNLFSLAILGYPSVWLTIADTLKGEDYSNFRNTAMYANFHTAQHAGGEVRGQLIPSSNNLDQVTGSVADTRKYSLPMMSARYDAASGIIELDVNDVALLRNVTVALYSVSGNRVAMLPVGEGTRTIQAGSIPAGMYFMQLLKNGTSIGTGHVAVVR